MTFVWIMFVALVAWGLLIAAREMYNWKPHSPDRQWSQGLVWAEGLLLGIFFGTAIGALCMLKW